MIIRLGLMNVDIPWDFREARTELILLPALAVTMTAALMTAAGIMLCTGLSYLGIGIWYPAFLALICVTAAISTLIWDTLALQWDAKVMEFLITIGLTALGLWLNTVATPTRYTAWVYVSGLLLAIITWFSSSYGTWVAGISIPPPMEELLDAKYSEEFMDHVIDGRVKREVYGHRNAQQMHSYWLAYTTSSFIFSLAFSLFWIQYRVASPSLVGSIVIAFLMALYVGCSVLVLILASLKSKEASLWGQRVKVIGGGWQKWRNELTALAVILGLIIIVIPANLSPIASSDLDSFASHFNTLMQMITKGLFSWVGYGPKIQSYGFGQSLNGARTSGMANYNGANTFGGGNPLTLIMLALCMVAIVIVVRYLKKKAKTAKSLVEPIGHDLSLVLIAWLAERVLVIVKLPFVLIELIKGWLRARLMESVKFDDEPASSNFIHKLYGRARKRMLRLLLPEDPSLLIRTLYARMMAATAQSGLSRRPEMTAHEYARYIKSRASTISPEVSELTNAYTAIRYARRKADKTMAEKAIACFRSIQRRVRTGLRREL